MRDKRINIHERTVRKMGLQELYSWDFLELEGSRVEKIQNRSKKEDGKEDSEETIWIYDVMEIG